MNLGIDAGIWKVRRDLKIGGHCQNRAKHAFTSEETKAISAMEFVLGSVAATAYGAERRNGFYSGFGEGFDGRFIVGEFAGNLPAGAGSSWNRML